jgi:transporter family-2 protein
MIAGVVTAYQPGVNAKFAAHAGASAWGGFINFAVGLVAMTIVVLDLSAGDCRSAAKLADGPWWMWLGGLCGAFFVTLALMLVPKMGSASYLTAMVAGQLVASLVIDRFGHMGLEIPGRSRPGRIAGVLLVIVGVMMVRKF